MKVVVGGRYITYEEVEKAALQGEDHCLHNFIVQENLIEKYSFIKEMLLLTIRVNNEVFPSKKIEKQGFERETFFRTEGECLFVTESRYCRLITPLGSFKFFQKEFLGDKWQVAVMRLIKLANAKFTDIWMTRDVNLNRLDFKSMVFVENNGFENGIRELKSHEFEKMEIPKRCLFFKSREKRNLAILDRVDTMIGTQNFVTCNYLGVQAVYRIGSSSSFRREKFSEFACDKIWEILSSKGQ